MIFSYNAFVCLKNKIQEGFLPQFFPHLDYIHSSFLCIFRTLSSVLPPHPKDNILNTIKVAFSL